VVENAIKNKKALTSTRSKPGIVVIKNTKINWGGGKKCKKYKKPWITKNILK